MGEYNVKRLLDLFRKQRKTYTRDALAKKMVEAHYAQADADGTGKLNEESAYRYFRDYINLNRDELTGIIED